jgi:transposase
MPHANTAAMQMHLDEIAKAVEPFHHAVILMDCAPWHTTKKLNVPANITIIPLPPVSPELNPVEQVWNWLRQNFLSNRVFDTYDAIVDGCCEAWNAFAALPNVIRSIGSRSWTNLHR